MNEEIKTFIRKMKKKAMVEMLSVSIKWEVKTLGCNNHPFDTKTSALATFSDENGEKYTISL